MNITNNDIKVLGRIVAITTGVGNGDNGIVADASQLYDTVQKDNQENINKRLFGSIDSLIGQIEEELADYYTKSQTYNRTEIDNMIAGMTIPDPLVVKTIIIKNNTTTCGTITTSGNSVEIDTKDGLTVKGNVAFTGDSFITNDLEATNATIHDQLICDLGIASSKSGNVYRFTVDQDGNVKAPNIKVESISNNHNNPNVPIFVNNPVALKSDLQFQVAQDEFRTISYNSSTGEVDFNLGAVHMDNNLTVDGDLTVEGTVNGPFVVDDNIVANGLFFGNTGPEIELNMSEISGESGQIVLSGLNQNFVDWARRCQGKSCLKLINNDAIAWVHSSAMTFATNVCVGQYEYWETTDNKYRFVLTLTYDNTTSTWSGIINYSKLI